MAYNEEGSVLPSVPRELDGDRRRSAIELNGEHWRREGMQNSKTRIELA